MGAAKGVGSCQRAARKVVFVVIAVFYVQSRGIEKATGKISSRLKLPLGVISKPVDPDPLLGNPL
jgi:hypothetical protein